jgi:general secretion pathway protein A
MPQLLALYGLKWNPFASEVPPDALLATPKIEAFCWASSRAMSARAASRSSPAIPAPARVSCCACWPSDSPGCATSPCALTHPQSHVADFYRELDLRVVTVRSTEGREGFQART